MSAFLFCVIIICIISLFRRRCAQMLSYLLVVFGECRVLEAGDNLERERRTWQMQAVRSFQNKRMRGRAV